MLGEAKWYPFKAAGMPNAQNSATFAKTSDGDQVGDSNPTPKKSVGISKLSRKSKLAQWRSVYVGLRASYKVDGKVPALSKLQRSMCQWRRQLGLVTIVNERLLQHAVVYEHISISENDDIQRPDVLTKTPSGSSGRFIVDLGGQSMNYDEI
ncbi:uncharacterized protein PgNI_09892 [Pyricularia grisea]|uniref:Uncharacterized protein n=1 Tax=Pyricularia grisea TaxID=148305 RepID=A0A6P8AT37_PYRGI|nr:uncharacterized protein PgNI_09892 [Pyricularia grisea]TLD05294.1 hypothetical protein PgNI_09892 [Pyricularia grisea]